MLTLKCSAFCTNMRNLVVSTTAIEEEFSMTKWLSVFYIFIVLFLILKILKTFVSILQKCIQKTNLQF